MLGYVYTAFYAWERLHRLTCGARGPTWKCHRGTAELAGEQSRRRRVFRRRGGDLQVQNEEASRWVCSLPAGEVGNGVGGGEQRRCSSELEKKGAPAMILDGA